ncbi:MAG: dihydropteridine reductase [Clostridia bacterium]|nr:dihydropteridine reductase [Clostridia bacterium]
MTQNEKEFLVQKIRTQYTEKEHTALDELKAIDSEVKRPANIFAYTFGSVSAIVVGAGMSLVMTDIGEMVGIGNNMLVGIIVGVIGLGAAALTYPIYKKILDSRKRKYAPEIMKISDKIMNEN